MSRQPVEMHMFEYELVVVIGGMTTSLPCWWLWAITPPKLGQNADRPMTSPAVKSAM
jgi:hypothetical protein